MPQSANGHWSPTLVSTRTRKLSLLRNESWSEFQFNCYQCRGNVHYILQPLYPLFIRWVRKVFRVWVHWNLVVGFCGWRLRLGVLLRLDCGHRNNALNLASVFFVTIFILLECAVFLFRTLYKCTLLQVAMSLRLYRLYLLILKGIQLLFSIINNHKAKVNNWAYL